MKKSEDFLVELCTEELPPKTLLNTAEVFCREIKEKLLKLDLSFEDIKFFATPRRLAVFVKDLIETQPDQIIERKGPALKAAFDAKGNPTKACIGFAKSFGVTPNDLKIFKSEQGEWVSFIQKVTGKQVTELLPHIIEQAVVALPLPKRMRWGSHATEFARPIHSVMMLYGDKIIEGNLFGCQLGRMTKGHRFHAPETYTIFHAAEYESLLRNEAYVIADFESRRSEIMSKAKASVENTLSFQGEVLIDRDLLDEVTGLVEWPVVLIGHFDKEFLQLPPEVLISAMQNHQRYFPVVDKEKKLLPYFVIVSNIQSQDPKRVISGNERVLRARLSDAQFFYESDKKESLESRIERLKGIIFQTKLGTVYEKAERLSHLAQFIAKKIKANAHDAKRAAYLAKTDLTTNMVSEFPELQGIMGYYYARYEGVSDDIAYAIREHYLPRFAGDDLPLHPLGQVLALSDRIDTLTGIFGINQIPTGDKDPFGLRRQALGVIRILVEKNLNLDINELLHEALSNYQIKLENTECIPTILTFIQERQRAWYQDQGISADVFASVHALTIHNPLDIHLRIKAVQAFKKLPEAKSLSLANKRVSNILEKSMEKNSKEKIREDLFENEEEKNLANQLKLKNKVVMELSQSNQYADVLLQLAELKKPIDDFFDKVMVMTEDKSRRENRILLLRQLRKLFLQVADIALLQ